MAYLPAKERIEVQFSDTDYVRQIAKKDSLSTKQILRTLEGIDPEVRRRALQIIFSVRQNDAQTLYRALHTSPAKFNNFEETLLGQSVCNISESYRTDIEEAYEAVEA